MPGRSIPDVTLKTRMRDGSVEGANPFRWQEVGTGNFTRRMGMLVKKDHLGFGERSWRHAMVVDNGRIVARFEEPGINDAGEDGDPCGETSPEPVLAWLADNPRV